MESIIGTISGAALGYIHGNIPAAIKGARNGYILSQKKNNQKTMPPYARPRYQTSYSGTHKSYNRTARGYRGSTSYKKYQPATKSSLHKMILADTPAKHYGNSIIKALLHNDVYTCTPSTGIVQGTSNTTRIGDHVDLQAIKIKGFFQTPTLQTAFFSYRIMVGWTGEEFNLPTSLAAGLGIGEWAVPNTTSNWIVNGINNPKAFTVLYDQTVDVNSLITTTPDGLSYQFTVPLHKKFDYQADGSVYGKDRNLCILVMSSVNGGTLSTTSTGQTVMAYDLIYK